MPWKVLLAMSTMPPVGRATTPTRPFPMPLKKPAAPSFLAPGNTAAVSHAHFLLSHGGSDQSSTRQERPSLTLHRFGDDARNSAHDSLQRGERC